MCGEKAIIICISVIYIGSPPHVRGKGFAHNPYLLFVRITPACAGKSTIAAVNQYKAQDHPRMCGEKTVDYLYFCHISGSPPHVRGKEYIPTCFLFRQGITPACAGKRLKKSALYHSFGSHKPHFSFSFKYTSFISKQSSSALCD